MEELSLWSLPMNPSLQELKNNAAALPASERAELVQFLLRTLDEPDESQARAEWLAVAEQRMAEVRAGQVAGVPAEEVLKTLLGPGR
jgi:putative addiction module component (TIGR02574 family)